MLLPCRFPHDIVFVMLVHTLYVLGFLLLFSDLNSNFLVMHVHISLWLPDLKPLKQKLCMYVRLVQTKCQRHVQVGYKLISFVVVIPTSTD